MRTRTILLPALLVFFALTGCARASSVDGAAYPMAEEAAPMAADEGAPDEVVGIDELSAVDMPVMAPSRGAPAGRRRFGRAKKAEAAAAPESASKDEPGAAGGEPTEPEPDEPEPKEHGRQIVYTATMQIGVYNVDEAMAVAEELPERLGGWVHSRSEGHITMKIPAEHLKTAMAELGELGNVLRRELQAQDVTAEYVDLETRIRVLRETQAQLLELLTRAKNVEEALAVRRALDDVTMQLETALGRMRQLQSQISFSTLTLALIEQGPHGPTPSSNDPFPWVDSLGVEATEWR